VPELPDIEAYLGALRPLVVGRRLERVRLASPFLLRSVAPPLEQAAGRQVLGLARLGKRIVIGLDGDLFLVLHLLVAGRLRWRECGAAIPGRVGLAAFDFAAGTLILTEAGSRKRASLFLVAGEAALAEHDPGGLEVLDTDLDTFAAVLVARNHTLKRALTDPRVLAGVGNAYSDEILHRARLSPFKRTRDLAAEETAALFAAVRSVLTEWSARLARAAARSPAGFPVEVTAFRPEMAVHGKFGKPCPDCGAPIQRIVYAANEANYCPGCQTGGKILADRVLSKLLKDDWPRTLEELEREHRSRP